MSTATHAFELVTIRLTNNSIHNGYYDKIVGFIDEFGDDIPRNLIEKWTMGWNAKLDGMTNGEKQSAQRYQAHIESREYGIEM
jgi:hypothetical protein